MLISEYYKEMRDKYGFNEGQHVPEGIEKVRNLIIKEVNKRIHKTPGYERIHLRPFDRPGVHNWCLIELWDQESGIDVFDPPAELEGKIMEIVLELDNIYRAVEKVHVGRYKK